MKYLFAVFAILFSSTSVYADDRPNIVLIMADDISWEAFGCYGAEDYETPNLDTLASKGVRFAHCYSTPICTPSRVMLMTGKYNFRNYTHFGYLNPAEKTFGSLMQDAGYRTAIAGKWQLNGLQNGLPGHDDPTRPNNAGFDEYCLWQLTRVRDKVSERFWSPPIEQNGKFISAKQNDGKYGPDIFCDFICDFMGKSQDKPFFAYYPMVLVHSPFVPTPDTIGDAPRTQVANKNRKNQKANLQAMVNYMDKIVGRIVAKTEELGIAENTLILFTADNGTNSQIASQWNGHTIKGGKGTMTDMGTHVPLIAFQKGSTPVGRVLDDLVDFTDIYPTLASAAGVEIGDDDPTDGRSFLPQLHGELGDPRDWVLCHYQPYWGKKMPGQFARNSRYKLYRDGRFYEPAVDLKEVNDLANDLGQDQRAKVHRQLQTLLDTAPPAPTIPGEKDTKDRPVYPMWKKMGSNDSQASPK
ncbi:MAG: sulfatase-like hydrolase/transferase [Rubripirellula sp.]